MPELPEVQTTVSGLAKHAIGLTIINAWSNYGSQYFKGSKTLKDPSYFKHFRKNVVGAKIVSVTRRAKNILIGLNNGQTILVHMKMTGHLLYGIYYFNPAQRADPWEPRSPSGLKDPFNRRVRFVLSLSNSKHIALSDMRRFAKVALLNTKNMHETVHLRSIGPEPLDKSFNFSEFKKRIMIRPNGKIKQVIMDQMVMAGVGNIYADESLWRAGIHPTEPVRNIPEAKKKALFEAIKKTLTKGINLGGDSMSDYRNVYGEKGKFQDHHYAYRKTGTKCGKSRCRGTIIRIVVGGRGTHFCPIHQKLESVKKAK